GRSTCSRVGPPVGDVLVVLPVGPAPAQALSRYQASRQAAQAVADQGLDGGRTDGEHDQHITDRRTNP
ncbi:hypothetical protein, partial [Pseudonocardia sp. NPDC049154]|uniref:hypothetical protein n=1 Tax=Pseudonocardia sp. NPDC049154 TaxID=3155501 RepID=UPI0033E6065B